ncbi:MAG: SusC/RagA family TonB-linked outer membrane protein [Saprospiraceae bacterium]|nr:SusC/RagA family TonB-linked outer membrane protein [Saprospiraceae bacterium]
MMKKRLLSTGLFLLWSALIFAQIQITGKVSDVAGEALIGASVVEKGTTNGTVTDNDGNFSLKAANDATLVITFVGYTSKEVAVANQTTINISLTEGGALSEVVVTALGVSREKKALGYSVQELKGSDITAAPEVSPIQNLAGQVPGLTLTRGTYGPGSSTRVSLRGERLIAGDNQPLYIIDGIPLDNSSNGTGPGEFGGADNGDGISNINPDDIETISVLKGANAAALYGSRANNGVIIITTKKGSSGKTQISYSTNFSTDAPSYQLKFQELYGQGDNGRYVSNSDNSWGGRNDTASNFSIGGNSFKPESQDHIGAFLQNGQTWNNNFSITTGNDRIQTRFSTSILNSSGLVPGNKLNRISINLRATSKLNRFLDWDAKINYINQNHKNRPAGGEEFTNPYSNVIRMPSTYPVSVLENYEVVTDNQPRHNFYNTSPTNFGSVILGNPYWAANRLNLEERRNRIIGMTSLTAHLAKGLTLLGRIGLDKYEDFTERRNFAGTPTALTANSTSGNYTTGTFNVSELNADALLRYETTLNDNFGFSIAAGANTRRNTAQSGFANAGGLDYINLFAFSNGRVVNVGQSGLNERIVNSAYGTAGFSYKNALYLDITGRNDWASTLAPKNRSFFYPSVSLSTVVSELVKLPEFVTFAKFRGSYAQVGNDASPYQIQQYLTPSTGVVGAILTNSPTKVVGEDLKPQQTKSLEFGVDLRFLQNKIGLDVSWYNTNTVNQIVREALRASSGFSEITLNAGDIQNRGLEVLLNINPINNKNFRWDVTLNYSRNRNKVIALSEKLNNFGFSGNRIATTSAKVGDRLGELFVKGYVRDDQGRVLIDTSRGLPVLTTGRDVYAGNIAPDWIGGVRNALSYKGLKFDFLIDFRMGGVVVSHTQAVIHGIGKSEATVIDGQRNNIILDGAIGARDDKGVWKGTGSANNKSISPEAYWKFLGGRGEPVGEAFTYDATVVRLRQITLSYSLPTNVLNKIGIGTASIGLYGRNLWFKTKNAPFDPEVALNTGIGGQGIDFYAMPTTSSVGFNLNINF